MQDLLLIGWLVQVDLCGGADLSKTHIEQLQLKLMSVKVKNKNVCTKREVTTRASYDCSCSSSSRHTQQPMTRANGISSEGSMAAMTRVRRVNREEGLASAAVRRRGSHWQLSMLIRLGWCYRQKTERRSSGWADSRVKREGAMDGGGQLCAEKEDASRVSPDISR